MLRSTIPSNTVYGHTKVAVMLNGVQAKDKHARDKFDNSPKLLGRRYEAGHVVVDGDNVIGLPKGLFEFATERGLEFEKTSLGKSIPCQIEKKSRLTTRL